MPSTLTLVLGGLVAVAALVAWNARSQPTLAAGAALAAEVRIIDVRSPGEYAGGHLDGALNVPVDALYGIGAHVPVKSTPLVVYCASGVRSRSARAALLKAGYTRVDDAGGLGHAQQVTGRAIVR